MQYSNLFRLVFPVGAILTISGVCLNALLDRYSYSDTQDWIFEFLSDSFFPALVLGTLLTIVGAFVERKKLYAAAARRRGVLCLAVSGICFFLLRFIGNVHGWTFSLVFPAFAGLVAGISLIA